MHFVHYLNGGVILGAVQLTSQDESYCKYSHNGMNLEDVKPQ